MKDIKEQSLPSKTEYLFKDEKIDKLLINLLQREIDKQSLNIDIDGMFLLLEEIIIENSGKMPKSDFDDYVKECTGQDSKNYLKMFRIRKEFHDDIPSMKLGIFSETLESIVEKIL